jgi:hypothetical protein
MAEYSDQSSFNMGMAYAMGLYNMLRNISQAFITQDHHRAEMQLRALYREMACKLKTTDRERVDKEFKMLGRLYYERKMIQMSAQQTQSYPPVNYGLKLKINMEKIFKQLEKIDITLRDYLESKGLLIPNKKDRSKFENVE